LKVMTTSTTFIIIFHILQSGYHRFGRPSESIQHSLPTKYRFWKLNNWTAASTCYQIPLVCWHMLESQNYKIKTSVSKRQRIKTVDTVNIVLMQCLVCQRHWETKKLSIFLIKYVPKSQGKSKELNTVRCSWHAKHACDSALWCNNMECTFKSLPKLIPFPTVEDTWDVWMTSAQKAFCVMQFAKTNSFTELQGRTSIMYVNMHLVWAVWKQMSQLQRKATVCHWTKQCNVRGKPFSAAYGHQLKNVTIGKIWHLVLHASEVTTPNTVRLWAYMNVATFVPPTATNILRWYTLVTGDILATIPEGHGIPNCSLPSNSWSLGYVPAVFKRTSHDSLLTCVRPNNRP
jgi:hypothetical protein